MKEKYKSIRMFENPFLEFFSHIHPATPFIFWIPIILYFLYIAAFQDQLPVLNIIGLYFSGMFFWTLAEYLLHRFVFHFPAKSKTGKYIVFVFHGIHHDDPADPTRLVMPPTVAVFLAIPFYFLFRTVFGINQYLPFFAGFLSGYLCYDFTHFATHHFKMTSAIGRRLKEYHMKHHYVAHEAKWGVSSPLWDHVFGTVNEKHPAKSGKSYQK